MSKELYIGYVPLLRDTKAPRYPWKTKAQLGKLSEYIHADWDDCSAVISEDYVVLDFDDERSCEIANKIVDKKRLKCLRNHNKHHLIFRKPDTLKFTDKRQIAKYLACGIKCDILVSQNGKYSLECIKKNGVSRIVETLEGELDELPKCFYPLMTKIDLGDSVNFIDQEEGRYKDLFKHRLTLYHQNRYEVDDIVEIMDIILTCVMSTETSLKPSDIERLKDLSQLTKTAKTNPYMIWEEDEKGKITKSFLARTFVIDTIEKYNIRLFNGKPYGFVGTKWIPFEKYIISVLSNMFGDELTNNMKTLVSTHFEAVMQEELLLGDKIEWNNPRYIVFNNGTYDWELNKLVPTIAEQYQTITCDENYIENAECEEYDKVITTAFGDDVEQKEAVLQTLGSGFYKDGDLKKAFHLFYGVGNNAKSLFTNCIMKSAGMKNCSTRTLKYINENQFAMASIVGKLFNIIDDCNASYSGDTGELKKVCTGAFTDVEYKHQDATYTDERLYCTIIGNTNKIIRVGNGEDAFSIDKRRHVVYFTHQYLETDDDFDPDACTKLLNNREFREKLLYESIQAFQRFKCMKKPKFLKPKSSDCIEKQFKELMCQQEESIKQYPVDTWIEFNLKQTHEVYKRLCGSQFAKNEVDMKRMLLSMYPQLRFDEEYNAFYVNDLFVEHMNWKLVQKLSPLKGTELKSMLLDKFNLNVEQIRIQGVKKRPLALVLDVEREKERQK